MTSFVTAYEQLLQCEISACMKISHTQKEQQEPIFGYISKSATNFSL